MKVVTLLNEKGGVGKTTVATTLAAGLAIRGSKVLLIDADAQANTTLAFGAEPAPAFHDWALRDAQARDVVRPVPPGQYTVPDEQPRGALWLLPGNVETRSVAVTISDPTVLLRRTLELREAFDYVIFDTAPSPSMLHTIIYLASDGIIYPVTMEEFAIAGLRASMAHRQRVDAFRLAQNMPAVETLGIVPMMVRAKTVEHTENLAMLQKRFGDTVWKAVPQRVIWAEATGMARSIFAVAPSSKAAGDGWQMVAQFEREVQYAFSA